MTYTNYTEFDNAYGFSKKAGFQLTEHQRTDAEKFIQWPASLNRYEVGSGKTVLSTVVALMRGCKHKLVIVPPILIRPWVKWLNQVSENVVQYQGTPTWRSNLDIENAQWVVASHAIFRMDFKRFKALAKTGDLEVIVDEAHALKSAKSILFKNVKELTELNNLQMLTGTPTSKPVDAYAYVKLKSPKIYRNISHFEAMHVKARDFFKNPTKWMNLDKLAENFAIQSIARTKEEVHGYNNAPLFPDTTYQLAPAHMALYEKLLNEQLLNLPNGEVIDASTVNKLYFMMQQVVVNWNFFAGDETLRSAAYDVIDHTIEETECLVKGKSKLIIWTVYKMTSRSILAYLKTKGVKAVGAYSEVNSQDSFDAFMEDEDVRILVAQPASAGAGLNPQSVCWESLFIENSTVPLHATQAIGRIDRVGQKHKPTVRFAVAENTVQAKLLRQLMHNDKLVSGIEGKKALKDALLGL